MIKFILLTFLFSTISFGQISRCQDFLLKVTNQFHHIVHGNFIPFRIYNYYLKKGKYTTEKKWVNLSELRYVHPINYPIKLMREKLASRIASLEENKEWILEHGISSDEIDHLMPSKHPFMGIKIDDHIVITSGNSRLYALNDVFEDISVEVNVIENPSPQLINAVKRLLKVNGLKSE